jgi:nucleotidyltransferase-like protein
MPPTTPAAPAYLPPSERHLSYAAAHRLSGALRRTVATVLAGGQGERLSPLTRDRAKPAVPFGSTYRIAGTVGRLRPGI